MDSKGAASGAAKIQFLLCALPRPLQSLGTPRHLPTSKGISSLAPLPLSPGPLSIRRPPESLREPLSSSVHLVTQAALTPPLPPHPASTFPAGAAPRAAPAPRRAVRSLALPGPEGAAAVRGPGKPELPAL